MGHGAVVLQLLTWRPHPALWRMHRPSGLARRPLDAAGSCQPSPLDANSQMLRNRQLRRAHGVPVLLGVSVSKGASGTKQSLILCAWHDRVVHSDQGCFSHLVLRRICLLAGLQMETLGTEIFCIRRFGLSSLPPPTHCSLQGGAMYYLCP